MTNFRFLILVFCFCRNDEILSFRNLSEKTETAPPSFPRRRESSLVGTETYRENGFSSLVSIFLSVPLAAVTSASVAVLARVTGCPQNHFTEPF
ncbi:pilS cassette [Neisseria meningitidis]|nr:pilS cassette [Neisseria meningitidis]